MYKQKEINKCINKCTLIGLSTQSLIKTLNDKLKGFHVTMHHHKTVTDSFSFSAFYDFHMNRIDIYLCCKDDFILNEDEYDDFKFELSATIQHEMIHEYQYSMRGEDYIGELYFAGFDEFNPKEDIHYYSDKDEIEAYAHDIMLELSRNNFDLDALRKSSTIGLDASKYLYTYYEVFKDWNHPVMKRLLKKCYIFKNQAKWEE